MNADVVQTLDDLRSKANCIEAYHVTTYQCLRRTKSGGTQEVRVEVRDAGPNSPNGALRYHVVAMSADGRRSVSGNPANSVHLAFAFVHWGDLDK
jgi:hypothetical protein